MIEHNLQKKLIIKEKFTSFDMDWFNKIEKSLENKTSETCYYNNNIILKNFLMKLFKKSIYSAIKDITGMHDLNDEKIIAIICREHNLLFEFLLKHEKLTIDNIPTRKGVNITS